MPASAPLMLHRLKKLEIVVEGSQLPFVRDLVTRADITGFTLIHGVAGQGHFGFHEGRLLFNDQDSLVMLIAVAEPAAIEAVLLGLRPFFETEPGVMFVSDVEVARPNYFRKTA